MKESDGIVDYKPHQMVLYVEKPDGAYGPLQTGSYMSKEYIDDFWEKRKHIETGAQQQLLSGAVSPIGYYMLLLDMTDADAARRVGIRVGQVKKHRTPKGFSRVQMKLLKRYADVFGVSVASLFCIVSQAVMALPLIWRQTKNPYIIIAEAKESVSSCP